MAVAAPRSSRHSSVGRFRLPQRPRGSVEIVHAARPCRSSLIVVSGHACKTMAADQFQAGDRVGAVACRIGRPGRSSCPGPSPATP